ncbi:MAG: hypothetical protein FWH41_09340 [Treponema sp.]|nr:hypothetical protein [Treponema sp.]
MALINGNHATLQEDQKTFWEDALKNARINFFECDRAINALLLEERKSYSMDTGQTTINVTRHDLPALIEKKEKFRLEVEYYEEKLGLVSEPPKMFQGVPAW